MRHNWLLYQGLYWARKMNYTYEMWIDIGKYVLMVITIIMTV